MGDDYEPYLDYLCGPKDNINPNPLMRQRSQENRMAWLTGLLQQHELELTDIDRHTPPEARVAYAAVLEALANKIDLCHIIVVQSLWRGKTSLRNYHRRNRGKAAMRIQSWFRRVRLLKDLTAPKEHIAAAVKIQAIWRGHQTREMLRKEREGLEGELHGIDIIEDRSALDWIGKARENAFDEDMADYLGDEKLKHFRGLEVDMQRSSRKVTPGSGAGGRRPSSRRSTIEDELIDFATTKESVEPFWMTKHKDNIIRHEALPPLGPLDSRLVNFDPLRDYLASQKNDGRGSSLSNGEKSSNSDEWGLQATKSQLMLARKLARDRALQERAKRRNEMKDPLQRLRSFYRHAYLRAASLHTNVVVQPSDALRKISYSHTRRSIRRGEEKTNTQITEGRPTPSDTMLHTQTVKGKPSTPNEETAFPSLSGLTLLVNNYVASKMAKNSPRPNWPTSDPQLLQENDEARITNPAPYKYAQPLPSISRNL
ncbi:hypothetical protein HDU76_009464 [Blyttiomyces sp. JEL0837]|nr:hypothetical protein HDU76_009464 [Blyttiomyces sp. JEL0837]